MSKFTEYKNFDLSAINKEIQKVWAEEKTFEKSIVIRNENDLFIFYEGPPTANGIPGIHHVFARTIKDIFCRYKTMKGYKVIRKAGWDTHGLPVELGVEKELGITKIDIGKKISITDFNEKCRKDVMRYIDLWEKLTAGMGFWIDMEQPYITYTSKYMETLWWLLKQLYDKGLLYKGYTIQPYSPAAGTGLSSHELNLPGCYKPIKDITGVVQFKIIRNNASTPLSNHISESLYTLCDTDVYILAWTTTPWTLLSNTALAVGKEIDYALVRTFNPYSGLPISIIMAKELMPTLFYEKNKELTIEDYKPGNKQIPYKILKILKGKELEGLRYEQLLPYQQPSNGDSFRVVTGDFVSTEEGTGVVHIAPSFGADDFRVAKEYGLGSLTLVDKQGKFIDGVGEFSGRYVKNSYSPSIPESAVGSRQSAVGSRQDAEPVDVDIIVKLKKENKLFKTEKYEHSYPHCWRTDKPILYYPLDTWFIKTTAEKERLIELNKTINWQPPSTGSGRFGQWLENLVDWNLSRSRFWGTPLPIWRTDDGKEQLCIGSFAQLKAEIDKAVEAGFMSENLLKNFIPGDMSEANYSHVNPHRPYVDEFVLVSPSGRKMYRETDLIDGWFDYGAMPYAQLHYPFENQDFFKKFFPADFIAEGVDQTRGWFFTLHAIAGMLFDSVAFKNIISNGLVLDKDGNKMSKRLGNAADPYKIIEEHGSDPLRWYMITNSSPWENLKFDSSGIDEVKRKFFGTLYNTYSFFALYANVDGYKHNETDIPVNERPELDRWIISLLNSLVPDVEEYYEKYEPTKAGRAIQEFITGHLSNWYVRLSRKRFWMGEYTNDKISAYQTLYICLETVARLASPIAPFYMDKLFRDLTSVTGTFSQSSVHLTDFPVSDKNLIVNELEQRMALAQQISSMTLGLRRKVNIKVRQPLNLLKVSVKSEKEQEALKLVEHIILAEVNVKQLEIIAEEDKTIVKRIKPNYKVLGPKYGKLTKQIAAVIDLFSQNDINRFEAEQKKEISIEGQNYVITGEDVEIFTNDIPGWLVASQGTITIALDINITAQLREEGIAREFINRIQNYRKESGLDVTDKIILNIQKHNMINSAIENHKTYIGIQTLAVAVNLVDNLEQINSKLVEIDNNIQTYINIKKA
ncbi:MAG: isoleucine--tRNA ligase [Bacteroidia bacterium]|nr:isoleucine--tRNA ligase [Bacteroidia bacterium]